MLERGHGEPGHLGSLPAPGGFVGPGTLGEGELRAWFPFH